MFFLRRLVFILCPIFECDDVEFVLVMKFDNCPTALYDHLIERDPVDGLSSPVDTPSCFVAVVKQ